MSYSVKHAYPAPPPTTNALTAHQRTQMLRSTQKLGRLLGSTPALLEETDEMPSTLPLNLQRLAVPVHVSLSSAYSDDAAFGKYASADTLSRASSRSDSDASSYHGRQSFDSGRSTSTKSVHVNDGWPTVERPYLRVAVPSARLDCIPQSPTGTHSPPPMYSRDAPPHSGYTLYPSAGPVTPPSPMQSFVVPSSASVRRQKMDKLRRTLGDGVPVDMVFPADRVPTYDNSSSSSSDEDLPRAVRAAPCPPPRIRSARDSMLVPTDVPRQQPAAAEARKLSMIAEREESGDRVARESARYHGDIEDAHRQSRRQSRVKRVPAPRA